MHSLKELREENAARRLRRTEEDDDAPDAITLNSGLGTVLSPAAAITSAPRVGRVLSPLASTSLQQAVSTGEDFRGADNTEVTGGLGEENRESRKIQWRRRQERERDKDNEGVNDGARASIGAKNVTRATKLNFPPAEEKEELSRLSSGNILRGTSIKDVVERREENPAPRLNPRGVHPQEKPTRPPPQEKPKKELTPLASRRARIEQQKRDEAEHKADVARESQLGRPSTPTSDESAEQPTSTENSSRRSKHASEEKPANKSPFERMTARARRRAAEVNQSPTNEENDTGGDSKPGGGKEGFPDREKKKGVEDGALDPDTIGFKGRGSGGDTDSVADALSGKGEVAKADERDDAAEERFKTIRSRMKKASEGLMSKRPSVGARFGRSDENVKWAGGHSPDKATAGGVRNSADADSGEGDDGPLIANQNADAKQAGRVLRGHQDNSDSNSGDGSSVLSPLSSDAEDDHLDGDGGAEIDHRRGRTKKRGKGGRRGPHDTAAIAGGDREVTLGHVVDRKMREMGYIRKPALDKLKNRRSWRDRVAAESVPEVHFIGELSGAEGFGPGVSCRFRVEGGRHWTCLAGLEAGQTHVAQADLGDSFCPWNHPIDLHYTTKSIQGWPRLMVQVWQLDAYGRNVLRGYGFRHLPSNPGSSAVSLPCWRPTGTMQEETAAFFLGVTSRLTAEDVVFNRAWDQRCRLVTLPAGTVWIEVNVLFRNLQDQDVDSLL